jgi:hypothetical protein
MFRADDKANLGKTRSTKIVERQLQQSLSAGEGYQGLYSLVRDAVLLGAELLMRALSTHSCSEPAGKNNGFRWQFCHWLVSKRTFLIMHETVPAAA